MKKNNNRGSKLFTYISCLTLAFALAFGCFTCGSLTTRTAVAENTVTVAEPASDPSPAIYVAQKNQNSVVGVINNAQTWNRSTGDVEESMQAQGSGVVIKEGGYILTNYHVVENGESFKILMPDGEKVEATLAGTDSAMDLAVLKVTDAEQAAKLVPVTVGSSESLIVGGTVVAIGNPGGEIMANTVTQGIVSALERTTVYSSNTTRSVAYIQHDAAINSGNSGGGLFNYKGELVGINTLKYSGSSYSSASYDGLGFAIPIDTAYPLALQLIENGKVIRPQIGITVASYEGPDEPMSNYAPASVCVYGVNAGGSAEKAGIKQYDFITAVNGQRVTTYRELTAIMDQQQAGDTVTLTIVRYNNVQPVSSYSNYGYGNNGSNYFFNPFGGFGYGYGNGGNNYGYGNGGSNYGYGNGSNGSNDDSSSDTTTNTQVTELTVGGGFETLTIDVTLEIPANNG